MPKRQISDNSETSGKISKNFIWLVRGVVKDLLSEDKEVVRRFINCKFSTPEDKEFWREIAEKLNYEIVDDKSFHKLFRKLGENISANGIDDAFIVDDIVDNQICHAHVFSLAIKNPRELLSQQSCSWDQINLILYYAAYPEKVDEDIENYCVEIDRVRGLLSAMENKLIR